MNLGSSCAALSATWNSISLEAASLLEHESWQGLGAQAFDTFWGDQLRQAQMIDYYFRALCPLATRLDAMCGDL